MQQFIWSCCLCWIS